MGVNEMKLTGIPPDPHIGANAAKDALARVPETVAVVKSAGVVEMLTLPAVSTSPVLLFPVATEVSSVQSPDRYSATRISASPLTVMSGVSSLCGSQPILSLAEEEDDDDTLQYSRVFETSSGGAIDVAVLFGEKYSAVHARVPPPVGVRVNLCPLRAPLPSG